MKSKSNSRPLFFLFTCVKDGRDYIEKLFQSLIDQTEINFYHYIYDDGSSEPMYDLIQDYKDRVSKLKTPYKIIYERNPKNIGLNLATKHCIEKSDCEYFIWVNCDDFIDSHFFEQMGKYVRCHKSISVARCVFYDAIKKTELEHDRMRKKRRKDKYQLRNFLYGMYAWSFFAVKTNDYRRINPDNILFDNKGFFNDEQVQYICAVNHLKTGFVKNAIGFFYKHGSNESLVNRINSLQERYVNYMNLTKVFDSDMAKLIMPIMNLRVLFNKMDENKFSNNKLSWQLFYERKKIIKQNKIPHYLRYRYGNSLYWFIKLTIAKMMSCFKN